MTDTVILTESQRQALQNHAQRHEPNESCAILYGKSDGSKTTVDGIFLTENVDESPANFTISDDELVAAYKRAEQDNTRVVGIFHSHPSSEAFPSITDRRFMEINPVVWIIYSGASLDFRAFVLEGQVREIKISG